MSKQTTEMALWLKWRPGAPDLLCPSLKDPKRLRGGMALSLKTTGLLSDFSKT